MNKLKEVFSESEDQTRKFLMRIHQMEKQNLEKRNKEVKLVKENHILYSAEPFQSFQGDCTSCSSYYDPNRGFITGGHCMKHNIGCGNGFICSDSDSGLNNGWEEFEKIRTRSGEE